MTTSTITKLPNGDVVEVRTNPGAHPITFINGVLQPRKITPKFNWQPWWAWRPVKDINGRWHWFKNIYRSVGNPAYDKSATWYNYGTILDVLKN